MMYNCCDEHACMHCLVSSPCALHVVHCWSLPPTIGSFGLINRDQRALSVLASLCQGERRSAHVAGLARETADLQKLSMMHVYGDPLKYRDLESKIAVEKFNSAIILCDAAWVDPDQVHHQGCCTGMTVLVRALLYIAVARMPQACCGPRER